MSGDQELFLLRHVFRKHDNDDSGYLSVDQFVNLIESVSRHAPEINATAIRPSVSQAVFSYIDKNDDGKMSFQEFYLWWTSPNRFRFFIGEKPSLLSKAYELFSRYSGGMKTLSYNNFERLLDDLNIPHDDQTFDALDEDGDGLMNFTEFVDWLGWFDK